MLSRCSNNRKRGRSALSSITNVHQNSNNKRIKKLTGSCLSAQFSPRPLHLNHLPFDCLSYIFSRISLQHRITRLSLVCQLWKSTVDEMCKIKGQLKINLFSKYKPRITELVSKDLEKYWTNVRNEKMENLILKKRNCSLPDLSVRFPLITQLVIRSNDTTKRQNCSSVQLFLSLLRNQPQEWCSSLTSLTLYKMTKITDPTFLSELCSMINRKFNPSSLTQLNLFIQAFGPEICRSHPERVTLHNVLPQLERFFTISSFKNWVSVVRTLGAPTSRNRVKELDLSEYRLSPENLTKLLSLTRLTSTVTHLHLTAIVSRAWFSIICESFGLLQFLQIYIGNYKFDAEWLNDLRKLNHLTELKIHRLLLDPTIIPMAVTTVKKLTICDKQLLTKFRALTGENRFNADQYCRLLSRHFPSVSRLILLSNEKKVKVAERKIRKWAPLHFKQIEKVVLVLKAVEFANHSKAQDKFLREHLKSLRN